MAARTFREDSAFDKGSQKKSFIYLVSLYLRGWKGPQGDKLELKSHTHTHTHVRLNFSLKKVESSGSCHRDDDESADWRREICRFPHSATALGIKLDSSVGSRKKKNLKKKKKKQPKKSVCSNFLVRVAHVVQNPNAQTR